MLITITGASGTGKSSLKRRFIQRVHGSRASNGVSTRPLRTNEPFPDNEVLSTDEFLARWNRGELLWNVPAGAHSYGMVRDVVDEALQSDGLHRVMILQPGVMPDIYDYAYRKDADHLILPFFIRTPTEAILRQRMLQRGDEPGTIDERIRMCANWESEAEQSPVPYIFIPDNDILEEKLEVILSHLMRLESSWPPAA